MHYLKCDYHKQYVNEPLSVKVKYFCPSHKIFSIFSLTALLSFVFYQRTLLLLHFPIDSLVWDMEIEIKFTVCNWDHEMFLQLKFKKQDVLQPKKSWEVIYIHML